MIFEERWLRETYAELLDEYAQKDERLVVLDADLMRAAGLLGFAAKYPERTFDMGVQEANMIGAAAGLSAMGKIPFTHTFTPFSTRRVCDQITISVAYAGLNVKIVGSDPGVTAEYNGGTHMSMEDVAIMRNIPGMTIFEPTDSSQFRAAFEQVLYHDGPVYMRLLRRNAAKVFKPDCDFTLGKGIILKEGTDVTIAASGIMTAEAVEAGEKLDKMGISAEIINIHTIKPLDTELLLKSTAKTGAIVTCENHSILNGLGSAVAESLAEAKPVPVRRVGVKDHFGEVGTTAFLQNKYGLRSDDIVREAKTAIEMKG